MVKEPSNFSNPIILCSELPLLNSIELIRVSIVLSVVLFESSIVLSVVLFEASIVLSVVLGPNLGGTWPVLGRWLSDSSSCLVGT